MSAGPEALQLVKLPFFGAKDVDYDVAKVQEYPAGGGGALPVEGRYLGCLEGLSQVLLQAWIWRVDSADIMTK